MTDGPSGTAADIPGEAPGGEPRWGRRKMVLFWGAALVVVLAIGFAVLAAFVIDDGKDDLNQVAALKPGDCAAVSGFGTKRAAVLPVPCTDERANYLVGVSLPGVQAFCPAGDYDVFQQSARIGSDVTLCLVPKFAAGNCYVLAATAAQQIPCKGSTGKDRIKVEQVLTGTTDDAKCTKGKFSLTFSQPASVYCFSSL